MMHAIQRHSTPSHGHYGHHEQDATALLVDIHNTIKLCVAALLGERMIANASRLQPMMVSGINVPRAVLDTVELVRQADIVELLTDAADDLAALLANDHVEVGQ